MRCELKETERGVQAIMRYTPPGQAAGGDCQIYLDDLLLPSVQDGLEKKVDFPVDTLQNGQHALRCEARDSSGNTHTSERSFIFDGSPSVTLTETAIDTNGLLDATVTLRLFGAGEILGMLDVLLDERPVTQTKLTRKEVTTPLSRLLGKGIAVGQLPAGTHLLTLRAVGINGAMTVVRSSFTVGAPELVLKNDKQGRMLEARTRFLPVDAGYPGSVEVWFDQDLLFSRRSEKEAVVITQDELREALKQRGRVDVTRPVTLVFALRSMNGAERWQAVEFIP